MNLMRSDELDISRANRYSLQAMQAMKRLKELESLSPPRN
jgi:hypothetical protein